VSTPTATRPAASPPRWPADDSRRLRLVDPGVCQVIASQLGYGRNSIGAMDLRKRY